MSGIRGVVFDLDDTLYPEREFVLSGFRAAAELFEIRHGFGGLFEAAGELFEKGCRGTIFNDALRFLGIEPVPRLVEALVEQYRAHRPKICLYPDGDWALTALRSTCQLAILSDGYLEVQERKLDALGLRPRVDLVLLTDSLGRKYWKPSPLPYREVERRLRCSGPECLYVGDNPERDFVMARELGWRTVRVRRLGGEHARVTLDACHEAKVEVPSLEGLEAVLAAWRSKAHAK